MTRDEAPAFAPVDGASVREWCRRAKAGDALVYFSGRWLIKTLPAVVAADALHARGEVQFVQRRVGPGRFDYCMIKCAKPKCTLSRSEIEENLQADLKRLLGVLKRLARNGDPCPSDGDLAIEADLKDKEAARYRLIQLVIGGHIDMATSPSGRRLITLRATGERTGA